ncbi:hypothetical protein CNR22_23175 [Sphingobacteriaceae bacterium]|nr:hypothetical protein CNR22_23175 [Sphingobacteriaceae bacterium]
MSYKTFLGVSNEVSLIYGTVYKRAKSNKSLKGFEPLAFRLCQTKYLLFTASFNSIPGAKVGAGNGDLP